MGLSVELHPASQPQLLLTILDKLLALLGCIDHAIPRAQADETQGGYRRLTWAGVCLSGRPGDQSLRGYTGTGSLYIVPRILYIVPRNLNIVPRNLNIVPVYNLVRTLFLTIHDSNGFGIPEHCREKSLHSEVVSLGKTVVRLRCKSGFRTLKR